MAAAAAGHDDGEHDPLATALREAREESGLTDLQAPRGAILDIDVHADPGRRAASPRTCTTTSATPSSPGRRNLIEQAEESLALEWFPLDEAARLMAEPGADRALARLASLAARRHL